MSDPGPGLLGSSIQTVKGVGPRLRKILSKKGIRTLEDALYFLPRAYEDRSRITPMGALRPGVKATVTGAVAHAREIRRGPRSRRFEATLRGDGGEVTLVWFHAFPSLVEEFSVGSRFVIHGEVTLFGSRLQIVHPEFEHVPDDGDGRPRKSYNFGRVVPIYSETEGLHQKTIRKILGETLRRSVDELKDALPRDLLERMELPPLRESFIGVHFPREIPAADGLSKAHHRIIFEEFFVLQLGLGLRKREREKLVAPRIDGAAERCEEFLRALPFSATKDQQGAVAEIVQDIGRTVPMSRLVQGDVGSGKTIVALAAAHAAVKAGYQVAMMVPTEILAAQHHKTAASWLDRLGARSGLLVQSTKKSAAAACETGELDFVVGTHAIFQKSVKFPRLALVIVDEQHRFGVEQRAELIRKGHSPHLLMMTATPIPRTLALTLYGDLDLSVIKEKPAGREPVETLVMLERDRPRVYQEIRRAVERGEQVYLIYPLVEASEKLDLKSAVEMYDRLRREVFPSFRIAILHGRMKGEEKDRILREFRDGAHQILVSTTVIEVGIDVPQATLMIVEHPERLGLSQLHQLRGRVGRGRLKSRCILLAETTITRRLRVMAQTDDGFRIAEEDLKIRGPGEFMGVQQSGLPGFRVGHVVRDASLLEAARREAESILERDPSLSAPEHSGLRKMVESRWRDKIERLRSG